MFRLRTRHQKQFFRFSLQYQIQAHSENQSEKQEVGWQINRYLHRLPKNQN